MLLSFKGAPMLWVGHLLILTLSILPKVTAKHWYMYQEYYLGCFADYADNRNFDFFVGSGKGRIEPCIEWCMDKGYKYAGLEAGTECWCSDTLRHHQVSEDTCNKPCKDWYDIGICGGDWYLSVYKIDDELVGCFDDREDRDLPHQIQGPLISSAACRDSCKAAGYLYAGLQAGFLCFCGNSYGKHGGRRSDDDCNTVCPNPAPNDGAFCGGPWRNLVYRLTWPRVKLPGLFEEYYDGCYQDHNHDRAFEWLQTQGTWADRCFDECTVWRGHDNRNYAALQYGGECWCGNVNKHEGQKVDDRECSMRCGGDTTGQTCGGPSRNKVYKHVDKYLGCFVDKGESRDLHYLVDGELISSSACRKDCRDRGFKYAGLQAGWQCFCGNTYGKHGSVSSGGLTVGADSECHSVCPDRRGYCGGGWRNAVYELKDPVDWSRHELEPIGCFRDAEDRDLEHLVSTHVNSPEHCALECRALGYEFIGLQIGRECRCSNSYGKYGNADNCHMHCNGGNHFRDCGGGWANFVYKINRPQAPFEGVYLGCFKEAEGRRDMIGSEPGHNHGINNCVLRCRHEGFKYAGLQNGDYCFCSDSFGSNGPSVHCTADCSIGEGKCGGIGSSSHNSVYLTTRSYLGCLRDSGRRDLEHRVATKVSIDQCISLCNIQNYQVAGLQVGHECFCGHSYGQYGLADNCDAAMIVGSGTGGGDWANSAFLTGAAIVNITYLGCWEDNGERDLKNKVLDGHRVSSIEECTTACKKAGYKFAAIQAGGHDCFCDDEYGRVEGLGRSGNCQAACAVGSGWCGGDWANSVYTSGMVTPDYFGCFADSESDRALPVRLDDNLSIQGCVQACAEAGFKFAGLEYFNQCFCGNNYAKHGESEGCSYQCTTGSGICGGSNAVSIYSVDPSYVGCYQDANERDLANFVGVFDKKYECLLECQKQGYSYAGLQVGNECHCGNKFGTHGKADENMCRTPCQDGIGYCGGTWSNAVYVVPPKEPALGQTAFKVCGKPMQGLFPGPKFGGCFEAIDTLVTLMTDLVGMVSSDNPTISRAVSDFAPVMTATLEFMANEAEVGLTACFGDFKASSLAQGEESTEDSNMVDICSSLALPEESDDEYTVLATSLQLPAIVAGKFCKAGVTDGLEMNMCLAISKCGDYPTVAFATDFGAFQCALGNGGVATGGISTLIAQAMDLGLGDISAGFSLTNAFEMSIPLFTGHGKVDYKARPTLTTAASFALESSQLHESLQNSNEQSYFELSSTVRLGLAVLNGDDLTISQRIESIDLSSGDVKAKGAALISAFDGFGVQMMMAGETTLTILAGHVPKINHMLNDITIELGNQAILASTAYVHADGQPIYPGIYLYSGVATIADSARQMLEGIFNNLSGMINHLGLPIKADAIINSFTQYLNGDASDEYFIALTANQKLFGFGFKIPVPFGSFEMSCASDYHHELECKFKLNSDPFKFFKIILRALVEGVMYLMEETSEFFVSTGKVLAATYVNTVHGIADVFNDGRVEETTRKLAEGTIAGIQDITEDLSSYVEGEAQKIGATIMPEAKRALQHGQNFVDDAADFLFSGWW